MLVADVTNLLIITLSYHYLKTSVDKRLHKTAGYNIAFTAINNALHSQYRQLSVKPSRLGLNTNTLLPNEQMLWLPPIGQGAKFKANFSIANPIKTNLSLTALLQPRGLSYTASDFKSLPIHYLNENVMRHRITFSNASFSIYIK